MSQHFLPLSHMHAPLVMRMALTTLDLRELNNYMSLGRVIGFCKSPAMTVSSVRRYASLRAAS